MTFYSFNDLWHLDEEDSLGLPCLGIEVTDPTLAARCELGNIDPQHGPDASLGAPCAARAALTHALPPAGTRLVTLRPDLDALAAMAVLTLRAEGHCLDATAEARLLRLERMDGFDMGDWPGARPLPTTVEELLDCGHGRDLAILSGVAKNNRLDLAHRVACVTCWLMTGDVPANATHVAEARAADTLAALRSGEIRVEARPGFGVATVETRRSGALELGYRLSPVVIAVNSCHCFPTGLQGRKFTIAAWAAGHVDLNAAARILSAREHGWGGQALIKGSPQDRGSVYKLDDVLRIIARVMPQD